MLIWLFAFLAVAADYPYKQALPGYRYEFPRDHFAHPEYRTEWWYYTGNVRDTRGRRFGFELVFFRFGERGRASENTSAWRVDDLYLAHAALTDIDGKRFLYKERINRAGPGIAGASFDERRVWNGNWKIVWNGDHQDIQCVTQDFSFSMSLDPAKPFVIHGIGGVSQKAQDPGRASYYVSYTRLRASGTLNGSAVTGEAWMDHEWFTAQLADALTGWDWFSIQLDDGSELMLFELRRKDGTIDPYSSGTFVDKSGRAQHLASHEFTLHPLKYWASPKTHASYPTEWRILVPSRKVELTCLSTLPNQELVTSHSGNSYWEGAVTYSGTHNGRGYLEMTGYDKPVKLSQ